MPLTDELEKLHRLRMDGALTEAEFHAAKSRLIYEQSTPGAAAAPRDPQALEADTRQWAVFLHLSQFLGLAVPVAGLVVPVLIWQLKKTDLPGLDAHGKVVMNWVVSLMLYLLASGLLSLVIIGLPLLLAVCLLAIIFPVMGAVKANDGELWTYPLSIRFFS